jgi:hypothetical protein
MELRDPRVQLTWASLRWAPRALAQGLRRQALGGPRQGGGTIEPAAPWPGTADGWRDLSGDQDGHRRVDADAGPRDEVRPSRAAASLIERRTSTREPQRSFT